MLRKVNLLAAASELETHWVPETVDAYNGDVVQVIKVKGEFVWHHHDRTDDLFLVLEGSIVVQLREGDIELGPGELLVVPAGIEHCVRADDEARLMVLEHLGDIPAAEADTFFPPAPLELG